MSEYKDESVNRARRYYLSRNRDHERVMIEITARDRPFLKIPEDEWVRATDYDKCSDLLAESVRMIEGYKRAGWLTNPASAEQVNDFIGRLR